MRIINYIIDLSRRIKEAWENKRLERAVKRFNQAFNGAFQRTQSDLWQEFVETDFRGGHFIEFDSDHSIYSNFLMGHPKLNRDGSFEIEGLISEDKYRIPKDTKITKREATSTFNKTFYLTTRDYPQRNYAIAQTAVKLPEKSNLERRR